MTSASTPTPAAIRRRYRLRFRKADDLRLVSHHDLMHCVERLLRRAQLPIAYSQGFHPQPKMAFALSLALGVRGCREVFELELTEDLAAADVLARMRRHAPAGLDFMDIRPLEGKSSLQVRRAFYRLATEDPANGLPARIEAFLASSSAWSVRVRPQRRRIDVRPFVSELAYADGVLSMALWIGATGAARPDEILFHLGLGCALEEGAILERSDLELIDELPESERAMPELPAAVSEDMPGDDSVPAESVPDPASGAPTPLLANPLSFDS